MDRRVPICREFPQFRDLTDEECVRALDSAAAGLGRRTRWVACVVGIGAGGLVFGILLLPLIILSLAGDDACTLVIAACLAAAAAAVFGAIMAAVFRRALVRGEIVRATERRTSGRGMCGHCGYSLVGLTGSEGANIVCPECGAAQFRGGHSLLEQAIARARESRAADT